MIEPGRSCGAVSSMTDRARVGPRSVGQPSTSRKSIGPPRSAKVCRASPIRISANSARPASFRLARGWPAWGATYLGADDDPAAVVAYRGGQVEGGHAERRGEFRDAGCAGRAADQVHEVALLGCGREV